MTDRDLKRITALSGIMAKAFGTKSSKQQLLLTTTQSVLQYVADIWAKALKKESRQKRLAQVQRRVALRIVSSFGMVTDLKFLVIFGIIPAALLARECQAVYRRKSEVGKETAAKEERTQEMADILRTRALRKMDSKPQCRSQTVDR